MSLEGAILGFLSQSPATGYDIKTRCFSDEIATFWPADQAQIYRTLKKLEENHDVRVDYVGSKTRPGRNIYTLTPLGKQHFKEWVTSIEDPPAVRDPFALKLYFSDSLSGTELKESLTHQKAELENRITEIDGWIAAKAFSVSSGKYRALTQVRASLEASMQNCKRELRMLSQTTT